MSRQAVSKWEMSQTTPDLKKIMAVAEFFGVSTDFLLKDELNMSDLDSCSAAAAASEASTSARQAVSLEEVQAFLAATRSKTRGIIISIILFLIAAAVMIILAVKKTSEFSFLKSSDSELAYVRGVVEEYKRGFLRCDSCLRIHTAILVDQGHNVIDHVICIDHPVFITAE